MTPEELLREIAWLRRRKDIDIIVDEDTGCWEWQGYRVHRGKTGRLEYGRLMVNYKHTLAHRVAWEIANGREVPDGMHVLHECDNPPCVNPDHLRIGTHTENMRDRFKSGKYGHAERDDKRPRVLEMRKQGVSWSKIAERLGIKMSTARSWCRTR